MNTTPFSLEAKNILITGASSGIGRQCAIACSEAGANVILVARNKERLDETAARMNKGKHLIYVQDITKYDQLEPLVEDAVKKIGPINGFVHAAGIEVMLPLKNMSASKYEELFSINVFAGLEFMKILARPKYCCPDGASIIFIASITGVVGSSALSGYAASKGALISAAKALAVELAPRNIRVNAISPGHVRTDMAEKMFASMSEEQFQALQKNYLLGIGQPEDVAYASIFLLSDASRWITGTNLIIDGGYCAK